MISAIAGRLRRIGLHADAIVGLQLANTVESVLTLLAVLRAGMIAMPLPLLWRRADAVTALGRIGANALIVSGRIGRNDYFDLALQVAAEIFPIRFRLRVRNGRPGRRRSALRSLHRRKLDPLPSVEQERQASPGPSAHLAVVTWDVAADGLIPVGRSHAELIAGGLTSCSRAGSRRMRSSCRP